MVDREREPRRYRPLQADHEAVLESGAGSPTYSPYNVLNDEYARAVTDGAGRAGPTRPAAPIPLAPSRPEIADAPNFSDPMYLRSRIEAHPLERKHDIAWQAVRDENLVTVAQRASEQTANLPERESNARSDRDGTEREGLEPELTDAKAERIDEIRGA